MGQKHSRLRLAVVWIFVLGLTATGTLGSSALAATPAEIVNKAENDYRAGKDLCEAVHEAFQTAMASDVNVGDIASALGDRFLQAGIDAQREILQLAGQAACCMHRSLASLEGLEPAERYRAFARGIEGMRAAAERNNLDPDELRRHVKEACTECAGSEEEGEQLARLIDAVYEEPVVEAYSPPAEGGPTGPPAAGPPPAPPSVPTGVSDTYDTTASPAT